MTSGFLTDDYWTPPETSGQSRLAAALMQGGGQGQGAFAPITQAIFQREMQTRQNQQQQNAFAAAQPPTQLPGLGTIDARAPQLPVTGMTGGLRGLFNFGGR